MVNRWLLAGCCVCLVATPVLAQRPAVRGRTVERGTPAPRVENTWSSRQSLGKGVTLSRLTNGLTVIVQENHSAPVATARCYVHNTGSAYEGQFLGAGISHMLEHILAGGTTKRRTRNQFTELFDSLGGKTNAYTTEAITAFHIDCPAAHVSLAIELIADNLQNSTIPENEFRQELGVVQRELEMYAADRNAVLYDTLKQLLYTEHPARHPIVGYQAVVQQVRREEVIAFYKSRYVPQNMTLVVVGDVQTDTVLDTVLPLFRNFQRTTERTVTLPTEPRQVAPRSARLEMEGATTAAVFAWPTVPLQDPDLYALDVASYILSNGDTSRLVRRLQMDGPLAEAVDCESHTPRYVPGWFEIHVQCDPEDFEQVRTIVFEEIRRLQTEPVSEVELAKAKRQKAVEHVLAQETVENQAEALCESYLATGDPLFDARYVEDVQAVTADQVRAVANRYFLPQRLNTVVIEPLGSHADSTRAVDEPGEAETPVIRKQLTNGLTVLLKRQASLPLVTLQAFVKAGSVADTVEQSGLSALTASMLEKGTARFSAEQIAEHFDAIGGTLVAESRTHTCSIQAVVLQQDTESTLEYLQQMLQEPVFPAVEFAKMQQFQLTRIADRQSDPQAEILDFWSSQLPTDSPYRRKALGESETVAPLTPDDCAQFHRHYFVPNNMVLAVFGDIDPEAVLERIEDLFGGAARDARFAWPEFPVALEPLDGDVARHLEHQKPNTAMALLAFPMVSLREPETRAAIDVLEAVVTGGGTAGGRFHEELRGDQLVYYVMGIPLTGLAPGYFVFLAQTRPESLERVTTTMRQGLDRIAREGIPAEEFERARAKLIVAHTMSKTTPAERAFQAALDELYGLGYDYDESYPERIGKVQVEDVVAVVKKFFAHGFVTTSAPE